MMKTNAKRKNSAVKKLIPAAGMLALSASMLATSTYAWFSMNKTVSVTGLNLAAKSNSTYLLIGKGESQDTAAEIQALNPAQSTVAWTITGTDAQVFPSAHTDSVTNATTAGTKTNWYYKVADDPSASASTKSAVTLTDFSNYVIHDTVYVTLAKGSQAAANLVVTNSTFTAAGTATGPSTTITPVKVVVASSSAVVELDSTNSSSNTVLATSVTDSGVVPIDIYLYYDGNDTSVYTNNIANLDGAGIDVTFGVTFASDLDAGV